MEECVGRQGEGWFVRSIEACVFYFRGVSTLELERHAPPSVGILYRLERVAE